MQVWVSNINGDDDQNMANDAIMKTIVVNQATSVEVLTNGTGTISLYPNPATTNFNVELSLTETNELGVDIYNVLGVKVLTVPFANYEAGNNTISINTAKLAEGVYILNVRNHNEQISTIKFVVAE